VFAPQEFPQFWGDQQAIGGTTTGSATGERTQRERGGVVSCWRLTRSWVKSRIRFARIRSKSPHTSVIDHSEEGEEQRKDMKREVCTVPSRIEEMWVLTRVDKVYKFI
jgi:hypothetical protein